MRRYPPPPHQVEPLVRVLQDICLNPLELTQAEQDTRFGLDERETAALTGGPRDDDALP